MILPDIKHYLMGRKRATLGDLAIHFDTEPEAMRGMLEQWVRKGRVTRAEVTPRCRHGCSKCCDAAVFEIYEWVA
jgi:putative ferrous iron transport protein C